MGFINYPVGDVGSTPALGGVGLGFITSQSFSAVASVSLNGCFTAAYDNYRIVFKSTPSTTAQIQLRWRAAGADNSAASYKNARVLITGTTVSGTSGGAETGWFINSSTATRTAYSFDVIGPKLAENTSASTVVSYADTVMTIESSTHASSAQFDGFSLIASTGTITGTVTVFGYQRA